MSEWLEKIANEFCEERVVEARVSIKSIEERFYNYFTEHFICSLPTMLFNLLIDMGEGHIF